MHQRVAAINDLSGLGRCSLTADIAVLAAMGIEACPLPTAVLTSQTGYPGFHNVSFTEEIPNYTRHWKALGVSFDGILSGYLRTPETVRETTEFLQVFHRKGTFYLCDPVLGDNGHTYRGFTDASINSIRKLAEEADLVTPNFTEFCILTGTAMEPLKKLGEKEPESLFRELTEKASVLHNPALVITGIHCRGKEGLPLIANLVLQKGTEMPIYFPRLNGTYSGTGDLFAAVLMGGRLQHRDLVQSTRLAGDFILRSITDAQKEAVPCNDGINYEPYLPLLFRDKQVQQ
jgi:pyridoxine kinase